jgi:hypothetical protein
MTWIALLVAVFNGFKTFFSLLLDFLVAAFNAFKTCSSAMLAVVSGLGMILTKNYSAGASDFLQALTIIFGGVSVVGLKQDVAKLSGSGQGGTSQPAKTS